MALKNFEAVELTELTRKLLKRYCEESGEIPAEVLAKALKDFMELAKIAKANKEMKQIIGGDMVMVNVQLFSPFTDFMKEYLAFFGSKQTLENFCMRLIYDGLDRLYRDLSEFVQSPEQHFIDHAEWFSKHSHLAIVSSQPQDESEE